MLHENGRRREAGDARSPVSFGSDTAANDLTINLGGAQRTFTIGNVWHQRGALQNGTFILLAGNGRNGYFHCYSAANNFTGPVTVNGNPNFVHLSFQTAGALPDDVTILLLNHGMIQGVQSAGYACGTLLANGRIDPASTGGIAFVNNENVDVDGAITASAVTVASGATLGGVGSFGKAVAVADGAALEAGSAQIDYADDHSLDFEDTLALSGDATLRVKVYAKDALATMTAAAVTGSGTVTVAMNSGDYSGTFLVLKSDTALPCTFAKGANCGGLKLLNNDTELWVAHVPETIIMVQ